MEQIAIRLSPELLARLDCLVRRCGGPDATTRSAMIRQAILLGLIRLERRHRDAEKRSV